MSVWAYLASRPVAYTYRSARRDGYSRRRALRWCLRGGGW